MSHDIRTPMNAIVGFSGLLEKNLQNEKKAKEYKHMTFYEAAQIAKEAEVKEMWLTHYSPSLTKPEEYMDEVREIFPAAIAAKDRRSVELVFSE